MKVTKFLVEIFQFKFLVMTEKTILIYNFFCHKIIQILIYFLSKNINPLKKVRPFPPFLLVYCLTRNALFINLLLLWWIMHFQNKKKLLLLTYSWLVLILLFCLYVFLRVLFSHFCYHKTTNSFIFIWLLLDIHIGFSWHNHFKACRLLLLFRFPRKLSSRLILSP